MLRAVLVSLAAAVLGCIVAALVLVGAVDAFSFVAVPFAWVGALLLLAPADAWLRRRRVPMPLRSIPLVIVGAIGFALIGGLLAGGAAGSAVMGGVYGMTTAACWAALTAVADRWTARG